MSTITDTVQEVVNRECAAARSDLARKVLKEIEAGSIVSHPSTDYQHGIADGIEGSFRRVHNLFTREQVDLGEVSK